MAALGPAWARHLSEDDEWVVRTALSCMASDLEKIAEEAGENIDDLGSATHINTALRQSAARYRETLARIELAD